MAALSKESAILRAGSSFWLLGMVWVVVVVMEKIIAICNGGL